MNLNLGPEEASLLIDILRRHWTNLREEIGSTERLEMRQEMHREEEMIKRLLSALGDDPNRPESSGGPFRVTF